VDGVVPYKNHCNLAQSCAICCFFKGLYRISRELSLALAFFVCHNVLGSAPPVENSIAGPFAWSLE
jgi:hypothetical protein